MFYTRIKTFVDPSPKTIKEKLLRVIHLSILYDNYDPLFNLWTDRSV